MTVNFLVTNSLLSAEVKSPRRIPCDRCHNYDPFRPSPPELIVRFLGCW
jgi:hypothetical protein